MQQEYLTFRLFFSKNAVKPANQHRNRHGLRLWNKRIGSFGVKTAMIIALCTLMIGVMLSLPEVTGSAAREALRVWGLDVVPSLFPYMVFCRLIASRLQRTGLPAIPAAIGLGTLGGSPSGAAVVSVYACMGALTRRQVTMLAAWTGTISPMFLLSTVNTWVQNARVCRLLLISHLAGAAAAMAIAGLITRGEQPAPGRVQTPHSTPPSANPIAMSVESILNVGGCIVFFSVMAAGCCALLPWLHGAPGAVLHAALEVSGGLHALCGASLSPNAKAVAMAAASGFSGLSILTQNLLFLRPLGIHMPQLVAFGLLRAVVAAAVMQLLLLLLL